MNINNIRNHVKNIPSNIAKDTRNVGHFVRTKIPFLSKDTTDTFCIKDLKVNKDALVGSVTISAVALLAFGCIKSIYNKIKELKEDKNSI